MSDYQRLIENIRGILAAGGTMPLDAVSAATAEYAEACEAVNGRLRKCGELLRAGLRSEAVQQCEMEPNLLNVVAMLDFPELSEWNAFLQTQGFLPEQPLLMEVASELNEAYAVEQPLASLLRRHRLLALGRAPLRDRVSTLRKLARLDVNNIVWQDDLRQYERARQQEIRRAADREHKSGNVAALEELSRDLRGSEWFEPPPTALVQQVSDSHRRLVRQRARSELNHLEPQLNDAFSQLDNTRGQTLRDRWTAAVALAGLADSDPLHEQVAPALEWLERHDHDAADEADYKAAVAELEQALDNEQGRPTLERRAHAMLRHDRSIPPVLEQRLRTRIKDLDLAKSRRVRLIVAGMAAAVALVGGAVGYSIITRQHADQVAAHVGSLQTLLEQRQYDEAQKHLDQLATSAPSIAADAEIQKLTVELAARVRDEEVRRGKFKSAIELAEKAGPEHPDRGSLEEAHQLALLDSEKAHVARLESDVAVADRHRKSERDGEFLRQLKELSSRLDALDRDNPDGSVLGDIRHALSILVTNSDSVSSPVLAQSKVLQSRIDALYKTNEQRRAMEAALGEISRAATDLDSFRRALEEYAGKFPETVRAIDFKRVIAEAATWKSVEAWNRFLDLWQGHDITRVNGAKAKELHAAGTKLLAEHGGYPRAPALRERLQYLEGIIKRGDGGEESPQASLNTLFNDSLIAGLWMVETKEPKNGAAKGPEQVFETRRYYLEVEPQPHKNGEVTLNYIVDFSRQKTKRRTIQADRRQYNGTAPQSALSKMALDELAAIGDHGWEPTFFKFVRSVRSDERLEPILKVLFLQKVLGVACEGSELMRASFARYLTTLNSSQTDGSVRWMDPENPDAVAERKKANQLLDRLSSLDPIGEELAKKLKALMTPLGDQYRWIGWLLRNEEGQWICASKESPKRNGTLFIAMRDGESGMHWSEIGQLAGAKFKLSPASAGNFIEGRPVYLVESATASPKTAHN